ncbi:MAG: hypothetical protein ACHQDY_03375 [Solirubrobacterales bacterium]
MPSPVRRFVVHFPAGMGLDIPNLSSCTRRRLLARGARGCPASAQVGHGHALTEEHAGALILTEDVALRAFLGPLREGRPTLEILGQGYSPLEERLVFTGTLRFDRAPYGEELALRVPSISTLPFGPHASTVTFSLTIGASTPAAASRGHRSSRRGRRPSREANTVIVPSRCPAAGFPFAAEFAYEDGSTGSTLATARCP